jgi:peroxiredoxin
MNNTMHTLSLRAATILLVIFIGCGSKTPDQTDELKDSSSDIMASTTTNSRPLSYSENLSFSEDEKAEKGFVLKGEVKDFQGVVYLHELQPSQLAFLDSVRVTEDGQFTLRGNFSEPTLCFLTFGNPNPPGIPVILSNNKLGVTVSMGDIINYTTNGDKDNQLISKLYGIYASHDLAMFKFNKEVQTIDPATATDSLKAAIQEKFNRLSNKRNEELINFVSTEKGSPATYFALTYLFEKPAMDILQKGLENMTAAIPQSRYTQALKQKIDQVGPLDIGGLAPDIALKNPEGEIVKLSSLRGKVVLIDFWASWCRPCRMENPNVKRVYDKYKDKGFEIYGVSLDKAKDRWVSAIKADGLPWEHVSDLKGWQNEAAQRYMVSSIPFTVLLDKNGRIIAKGLRAEALENKLEEIFN